MSEQAMQRIDGLIKTLNRIIPELKGNGKTENIGYYGRGQEQFTYIFSFYGIDYADLNFCPWVPDDRLPGEFDHLLKERNPISFKLKTGADPIQAEAITSFRVERGSFGYRFIELEQSPFYEEYQSPFVVRYDFESQELISIIPKITFASPARYDLCKNRIGRNKLRLVFNTNSIMDYYKNLQPAIKGENVEIGSFNYPLKIDIDKKIQEMIHSERGLVAFINAAAAFLNTP